MDIRDFNKIVIVSLCDSFSKDLGNALSQNLGMIFCDTKELIEYELIDKKAIEELCTKDYLEKSERSVISHIASFENVVVAINYDYLLHNINILKSNSLIVFVNLPKTFVKEKGNVIDYIAFDERVKTLKNIATLTVSIRNTKIDFVCKKVMSGLGGIL